MKKKINAACAVMAGFLPSLNKTQKQMVLMLSVLTLYVVLQPAHAAVTGAAFKTVYDFIYGAATGYLGRSIAIVGGVIGLGLGAGTGKALPAAIGIILAIFGSLGPTIVNSLFSSAIV